MINSIPWSPLLECRNSICCNTAGCKERGREEGQKHSGQVKFDLSSYGWKYSVATAFFIQCSKAQAFLRRYSPCRVTYCISALMRAPRALASYSKNLTNYTQIYLLSLTDWWVSRRTTRAMFACSVAIRVSLPIFDCCSHPLELVATELRKVPHVSSL